MGIKDTLKALSDHYEGMHQTKKENLFTSIAVVAATVYVAMLVTVGCFYGIEASGGLFAGTIVGVLGAMALFMIVFAIETIVVFFKGAWRKP
jgi:uncharacterized membrane protein